MLFNLISIFHVANSPLDHDVFFFFEVWICLEFVHLNTEGLLVFSFLYLQNIWFWYQGNASSYYTSSSSFSSKIVSWEELFPFQCFGRSLYNWYCFFNICLVEFTSKAILAWSFLWGIFLKKLTSIFK